MLKREENEEKWRKKEVEKRREKVEEDTGVRGSDWTGREGLE